jgi:hypothetical protein
MKTITITITVPSNSDVRIQQAVEALSEPQPVTPDNSVIPKKLGSSLLNPKKSDHSRWTKEETNLLLKAPSSAAAADLYEAQYPGKRTRASLRVRYNRLYLKSDTPKNLLPMPFVVGDKVKHTNNNTVMMKGTGDIKRTDRLHGECLVQFDKCLEWVSVQNLVKE